MTEERKKRPQLPARSDYGSGTYRRRIQLRGMAGGQVRGELADDFHHFVVEVTVEEKEENVEGARVLDIRGEDVRVPWTTCPGALAPLRKMIGAKVSSPLAGLVRHTPGREQCTHLHDLACLAIAHAGRMQATCDETTGASDRVYDVALPDRVAGKTAPSIRRDGSIVHAWSVEGNQITRADPEAFSDRPLAGRPFQETLASLADADLSEAAWILQRAVFVGTGRRHDFEKMPDATHFAPIVGATCHSFADERVRGAKKIPGTVRDFSQNGDRIFDREVDDAIRPRRGGE